MRRRITLLSAGTALVAVLLLAVPLGVIAARGYVNDERLELQRAAATAAATIRGDRPSAATVSVDRGEITVSVYDGTGRLIDGGGPPAAPRIVVAALRGAESTTSSDDLLSVAAPVSDGDRTVAVVLLTTGLGTAHQHSELAWLVLAAMSLAAVGLAALGARLVAARLAAPIDRLTETSRRMGSGDLSARAAMSGVAEFDTLAGALNDSAAQIETMLSRERSFSAEVSHQLRTPLSGLRLELEASDRARALEAVDRLEATIDDVIGLARDLPTPRHVRMTVVLEEVERRWHGPLAARTRPLRIRYDLEPDAAMQLSGAAATQILDVLLDNALTHGRGEVTVHVRALDEAVAIDVSDEGPALTVEPHEVFRRRDADNGRGIGLPFARRLAEAEGARVVLGAAYPPTFSLIVRTAGARSE